MGSGLKKEITLPLIWPPDGLWSMDLEEITPAWKKRATIMTNYFSIPGSRPLSWPPLTVRGLRLFSYSFYKHVFAKPKNQCMMTSKN